MALLGVGDAALCVSSERKSSEFAGCAMGVSFSRTFAGVRALRRGPAAGRGGKRVRVDLRCRLDWVR